MKMQRPVFVLFRDDDIPEPMPLHPVGAVHAEPLHGGVIIMPVDQIGGKRQSDEPFEVAAQGIVPNAGDCPPSGSLQHIRAGAFTVPFLVHLRKLFLPPAGAEDRFFRGHDLTGAVGIQLDPAGFPDFCQGSMEPIIFHFHRDTPIRDEILSLYQV